jgi:HK97 gp10 family phage protein
MPTIGTVNTSGFEAALRQLPNKLTTDKVVEKALKVGADVVRQQAKANLYSFGAVDTGLLANTMSISRRTDQVGGLIEVVLKPSGKKSRVTRKDGSATVARPSKYAHLVENGTERVPARPFMRNAFETKQAEAGLVIRRQIEAGVAGSLKSLGFKAK